VQDPGENEAANSSRAPRSGLRLMVIILAATALVAVYANVQKSRHGKIEKVTIVPVSAATPTPSLTGN
jgi:hypothetical protein